MAKKKNMSAIDKVAKRFGITAREARDIATAVGTVGKSIVKAPQEGISPRRAVKNLGKQVKETAKAATKGEKGTTSGRLIPSKGLTKKFSRVAPKGYIAYKYKEGKKR